MFLRHSSRRDVLSYLFSPALRPGRRPCRSSAGQLVPFGAFGLCHISPPSRSRIASLLPGATVDLATSSGYTAAFAATIKGHTGALEFLLEVCPTHSSAQRRVLYITDTPGSDRDIPHQRLALVARRTSVPWFSHGGFRHAVLRPPVARPSMAFTCVLLGGRPAPTLSVRTLAVAAWPQWSCGPTRGFQCC